MPVHRDGETLQHLIAWATFAESRFRRAIDRDVSSDVPAVVPGLARRSHEARTRARVGDLLEGEQVAVPGVVTHHRLPAPSPGVA